MQRELSTHGVRLALAALAGLAVAPAARADESLSLPVDPAALAATLVQPATVDVAAVTADAAAAAAVDVVPMLSPPPAPQAVPAAAAEPIPASEPQPRPLGTPPPPQPAGPAPEPAAVAPDPHPLAAVQPVSAPSAQPVAVQQYQPEPAQYQPLESVLPPACDVIQNGHCGTVPLAFPNIVAKTELQYHGDITRYHPPSVLVFITAGSGPATALPAAPDVVAAAELVEALVDPATAPAPAPDAGTARAPDPAAAATPAAAGPRAGARAPPPAATVFSSRTARPATPARVRPQQPQAHRSRPSHRRLTRHPPSPSRAPVIPVSSAGAAPLGGADGGGLHSLLLVPLALALVDSVRRAVREAAPPAARDLDKRRKRPG